MDAVSYSLASKQAQRIEKFIENPDSSSGIVTVPKVIAAGETITIPAGRVAVLPNVQVDGTLNVEGDVFIPSGATFGDLENQIALKASLASPALTGTPTINGVNVSGYSGFKNYVINGGFDVWQRGISFSGSSEYTADRWKAQIDGNVGTKNRSTNVPTGYKYALSLSTTGSASFAQIGQHIEFVNFKGLRGKTATLSFWVKANNTNIPTMTYRIRYATNLEDETILFSGSVLVSGSKTVSTTWQKHTASFDVPIGTTSMSIEFAIGAVSNGDIFYIAGVQLEEGSVATPFENRPYGLELSLCQRYYEKSFVSSPTELGGLIWNDGQVDLSLVVGTKFSVEKRKPPQLTIYAGNASGTNNAVNTGTGVKTVTSCEDIGTKGFGRIYISTTNASTWQSYHYEAIAEL